MEALLYVADDIKSLADQKTLMVGVYTDRVLVVHVPKDDPTPSLDIPIALMKLSLMLTVIGLTPGVYEAQPVLTLPDGSPSPNRINPAPFSVQPGGAANLLFELTPFIVPMAGKYKLGITVDGAQGSVESTFEVRFEKV